MAARIFLYLIAVIIVLLLGAGIVWNLYQDELIELALVPSEPAEVLDAVGDGAYADAGMWLARPDIEDAPSDWLPAGFRPREGEKLPVFYVLPTTYLGRDRWNAPIDSPEARERQALFAASQASAFTGIGEIWAPYYRQAVIGAFLTDDRNAEVALRYAYRDVEAAFDEFLEEIGPDRPFLLVGHSQGALHLVTLLDERIAGTPLAGRVAAAYLIGWPISVEADLPALGLPACEAPGDGNCIVAFQSFAEPADAHRLIEAFDADTGLAGTPRRGTDMLCVNPLTGTRDGAAGADANLGALVPDGDAENAALEPGRIPARCGERGLLLIGAPPDGYDRYVLPGNNYHVFDFMLFWRNLRDDAARRTAAYLAAHG